VYIYDEVIQKNNNGQLTQGTFEKHPFKGSAKESVNMLSLVFLGMYDSFFALLLRTLDFTSQCQTYNHLHQIKYETNRKQSCSIPAQTFASSLDVT